MGKTKATYSKKCKDYVQEFGGNIFSAENGILLCRPCNKPVTCNKRFLVTQHLETASHLTAVKRSEGKKTQIQLKFSKLEAQSTSKSVFFSDLCEAFINADIPFQKLQNPKFREFMEKYTSEKLPDESTIRKNYLPDAYDNAIHGIRNKLENKYIWLSIDETTDSLGRHVTNVVAGALDSSFSSPGEAKANTFLLHTLFLEETNHSTIAKSINDALQILWPSGIKYEKVLLLVTDAASYMVKAAEGLKILYTKMIHLTCMDHALNRVCEKIRTSFPDVNKLISKTKKVFVKAPKRRQTFSSNAPGIPLPPEPVLTRWGTWLSAALYYADNFDTVQKIVYTFDSNDAECIGEAKKCFEDGNIRNDLAYVKANFSFLVDKMKKLEGRMHICESVYTVTEGYERILEIKGENGKLILDKFKAVLERNEGWKVIKNVSRVLAGDRNVNICVGTNFSPVEISNFIFAPITSCDVERTFSKYKSVLRSNRLSFTKDNIKMYFVSHCFANSKVSV